jgi:hypothetical protein
MSKKNEEFNGFNFSMSGSDIVSDISKSRTENSETGLTGDIYREDIFFDEDMEKLDKELNEILKNNK